MRKNRLLFSLVLLAASMGCRRTGPPLPPDQRHVRINITANPASGLVTVAQKAGRFRQQGLDAELVIYDTGRAGLDDVIAGKGDLACAAETPLAWSILHGAAVKIVTNIGSLDRSTAILARTDRGITQPRFLAGKTIGITNASSNEYFCYLFLMANGMEMTDVTLKSMSPPQLEKAWADGSIDAICLWHPNLERAQKFHPNQSITFDGDVVYMWTLLLSGRTDYVESHPLTMRAVVRALIDAQSDFEIGSNTTYRMIAESHGVSFEWVKKNSDMLRFEVALDQATISVLDDNLRWTARKLGKDPDAAPSAFNYVYWDALQHEKPEAISIVNPAAAK